MKRDYHRWFSPSLGRDMELLVFGHAGLPAVVFPSSCGRFYQFEEFGMVEAVRERIEGGHLQLFCLDSVDGESWYNRRVAPRWRVARHMQYQSYVADEVCPLVRQGNQSPFLAAVGCSFGGFHAASMAFRRPDLFTGFLSMSGIFDPSSFLSGYYDEDCYFSSPTHYLPNAADDWRLDLYRSSTYVLATGVHDQCWDANERMAAVLRGRGIPHQLDVWGDSTGHDWPWWQRMARAYL